MELHVEDNPDLARFEARTDEGKVAGFVEYERTDDALTLFHTEVPEEFGGQGVGSRLVRGALQLAREDGRRVVNECPFIHRFLHRHEGEFDWVSE